MGGACLEVLTAVGSYVLGGEWFRTWVCKAFCLIRGLLRPGIWCLGSDTFGILEATLLVSWKRPPGCLGSDPFGVLDVTLFVNRSNTFGFMEATLVVSWKSSFCFGSDPFGV